MTNELPSKPKQRKPLLLDGGMGTMLISMGLKLGDSAEAWNLTNPQLVQQVHQAYVMAGAQIILTNTLGANRARLATHQLDNQVAEINQQAVALARASANNKAWVAGSVGIGVDVAQITALVEAGVDLLWVETMVNWEEMATAVHLIRSLTSLPLAVTMSFHGQVLPRQLAQFAREENLWACGANCGEGLLQMEAIIGDMHAIAPELPLIAKSNAGLPDAQGGYTVTPEQFIGHVKRLQQAGATLIGGCCGIHPSHIKAIYEVIFS